jgi:hypothetical protein
MTSKTVTAVFLMRRHPVMSILTVNANLCKPYGRFYWTKNLWTPTEMVSSFDAGMGSLDAFSPASLLTRQTIQKSTCFDLNFIDHFSFNIYYTGFCWLASSSLANALAPAA